MTICSPSASKPGICRARAPVAKITCLPVIWLLVFPVIATCHPAAVRLPNLAVPSMTTTLFFFNKWATPPDRRPATFRDLATTFSRLTEISPVTSIPNSDRWSRLWRNSAARNKALVGMQPQFRQMPPRCSFSTTQADRPSCAARMAATYPPGPPPTTTTSNTDFSAMSFSLFCQRGLHHRSMVTGFSTNPLKACSHCAPKAPSTIR